MPPLSSTPFRFALLAVLLLCVACSGGGSSSADNNSNINRDDGVMMSFSDDIEPIMQAKCTGCHNSGNNPVAPFSLEGSARVNGLRSAIMSALETHTMPPLGAQQLSENEYAKFIAWLTDQPYVPVIDFVRIALVEAEAWGIQSKNRDPFLDHRPAVVDCSRDSGWLVEDDQLEVRTEFCNYLSLTQQSLLDLDSGTQLELVLSHSDLTFNAPATAHLALSLAGSTVWETEIDIPSDKAISRLSLTLPFAVKRGDAIAIHLHNHGENTWSIHSLDALLPSDQELDYCPTFDSTFEAIQAVVFERAGCANSLCHGEAKAGELDLSPDVAFDNLVAVASDGSGLLRVNPRRPSLSYLYHKLSAKTFPGSYDISGAVMPSAGAAISAGQLEAIRLWIEAGAPRDGSVGDTLGRGEEELERLLGVCLPEAEALNTTPLPPPPADLGLQFIMPPHDAPAEQEREICFAVYEDFRGSIPSQYMDASADHFYVQRGETREDAFTHHNILMYPNVPVDQIHDPSFGQWSCTGGDRNGQVCEPTNLASCGSGKCISEIKNSAACRGYGPGSSSGFTRSQTITSTITRDGFYEAFPSHGIFYWNSHAFNLTTQDAIHHVWKNFFFTDDLRFKAEPITYTNNIFAATGTQPFTRKTVCRDYLFNQGDGVLWLTSHTHKRGEEFTMALGGEQIYQTFNYDEPLLKLFDPGMVFNSSDPVDRTLEYCATYNNGVNKDGSPNIETVTRLSRRPVNASKCNPTACVAGNIGSPCNGVDDNASCDSSDGAGDGLCDACAIGIGITSDDEMFILLGGKLPNFDQLMNN